VRSAGKTNQREIERQGPDEWGNLTLHPESSWLSNLSRCHRLSASWLGSRDARIWSRTALGISAPESLG
jgi:hypothetical protein